MNNVKKLVVCITIFGAMFILAACGGFEQEEVKPVVCDNHYYIKADSSPQLLCEYELTTFPNDFLYGWAIGEPARPYNYGPDTNFASSDEILDRYYIQIVNSRGKFEQNYSPKIFNHTLRQYRAATRDTADRERIPVKWTPTREPGVYTLFIKKNVDDFNFAQGVYDGFNAGSEIGQISKSIADFSHDPTRRWKRMDGLGISAYSAGWHLGMTVEYSVGYYGTNYRCYYYVVNWHTCTYLGGTFVDLDELLDFAYSFNGGYYGWSISLPYVGNQNTDQTVETKNITVHGIRINGEAVPSPTGLGLRGCDANYGCGYYGASRSDGTSHAGIDIVSVPGQEVLAPISGNMWYGPYGTEASPVNANVIEIVSLDEVTSVKIFYTSHVYPQETPGAEVQKGDVIGTANDLHDLTLHPSYGGPTSTMENHIHLEVRINGVATDPTPYVEFPEAF